MAVFQKIDELYCQYNKNVLPVDFLNDNAHVWTASLSPGTFGTITAELQTEVKYLNKGLRIITDGLTDNDIHFVPANPVNYSFSPEVSGKHFFSFVANLNSSPGYFVELIGNIKVYEYPSLFNPFDDLEFAIGANTVPEFSFQYEKWEVFFVEMELDSTKTYILDWNILQGTNGAHPNFDVTFDLFQLEYVGDKRQDKPSFYTKPGE